MTQSEAGKGDSPRKTQDQAAYAKNWDTIFGKTRFDLVSDLHLEFGVPDSFEQGAETLVIAGDLIEVDSLVKHDKRIKFLLFLAELNEKYKRVLWVFGNHEHYNSTYELTRSKAQQVLDSAKLDNFQILENETTNIGNVTVFGGTFWTSVNNGNPVSVNALANGMNDFRLIRKLDASASPYSGNGYRALHPLDTFEIHKQSIQLMRAAFVDKPGKKLLIMHHAPSFQSVPSVYAGQLLNDGYASDLYPELFDISDLTVVHGHMHKPVDYTMGSIRVISNPRGYCGHEAQATNYKPLTIEL